MSKLAIVLSAGGARGAYEAGVIYYIRKSLPQKTAQRQFQIMVGTSVGGMNTVAMASMADDADKQAEHIKDLWFSIQQDDVYSRDFSATTHFLGSTIGGIVRNLVTFNPFQLTRPRRGPHFNSFLDTSPLHNFLKKKIDWDAIKRNVDQGTVDAVALNATNLRNGRHELFVKRKPSCEYQGHYPFHDVELGVQHAMASAAIPIIFPAIKIDGTYYADGGLRLFTPMSPAIQLGADAMVVVGLRYRSSAEKLKFKKDMKEPTIALQLGRVLNGLFLDRIEYDMEQLERINSIIDTSEKVYGADYLERLNKKMLRDGLKVDIATRGLRKIRAVEIKPSQSISGLFLHWMHKAKKEFKFTSFEKLLVRVLDIDPATGSDLLSYLTFAPAYLQTLFDLGYEDAKKHRNQLIDTMNGE